MTYSNTHQALSDLINNPEVLTDPQKFLGPNYQAVLRLWLYCESLTDERWEELDRRWRAIDYVTRRRAWELAKAAAIEVIGEVNGAAVFMAAPTPTTITNELIANLEEPFFLPLLVPEFNYKQN